MMLDKNTEVKVRSLDEDIDAGVLQGDTLTPYLFIICLDCTSNIDRFNGRKGLHRGKGKKQTIPRTNYHKRELSWWHSASGKYTGPGQIPAA